MASYDKKSKYTLNTAKQVYNLKLEDYESMYALPKRILRIVGLRTLTKDTKLQSMCWNAYFWFNYINVSIGATMEAVNMTLMALIGTFLDLFTMMPCVGYILVALVKAYKIKRYRSMYENLVSELREMLPNGPITEKEFSIISEGLNGQRFLIKAYFCCNMLLGSIFVVIPFISWAKHRAGYDNQLILPFFYWLPFDPYVGNRYEITFVIQTCHCFLSAGFMLAGDLLFCIFLSHITTQFALLVNRINKLIFVPVDDQLIESYPLGIHSKLLAENEYNIRISEEEKEKRLNKELVDIIHRHQALIRLSSDVESLYTFSLLVNFMNSSVIICFCLFCCAFVEKWNEFMYKIFFITAILQIWILCWYGQRLLDTSTGVGEALYNCGWYLASNKIKKSVLIMMHRSQKHVCVTTYGFSIISLESYATILKTSWSYFTLLINIYN